MSEGVNVTLSVGAPTDGIVLGAVHAKVPLTAAEPPINSEEASVCPEVMSLANGQEKIAGVFWTFCEAVLEVIEGYVELPGHDAVIECVPIARLLVE